MDLRENTEIHTEVLEHLGKGVSYYDKDLRLIYCNQMFYELLDLPTYLGERGRHISDVFRYNAERGDYGEGDIEELVKYRVDLAAKFEEHLFERTRPDGTVIRIEGHEVPGHGFVTTYENVTELAQTRTELEDLNRELDQRVEDRTRILNIVLDSIKNGITLFDRDLNLTLGNKQFCELIGVPEYLIEEGTKFEDIMRYNAERGEYGETDIEALIKERVGLAKKFEPHDFVRERPDGTSIEVVGKPISDGFVTTYTDVTAYKELEKKLRLSNDNLEATVNERTKELLSAKEHAEEASRSKTHFLAHMSHELRTPLNSIIGFSEAAKLETFGPVNNAKYKEYFETINTSGSLLLDLINDILQVAKMDAGKTELRESLFDPEVLVRQTVFSLEKRAEQSQISLTYDVDIGNDQVFADSRKFQQILLNLLTNAIKFSSENGKVHLKLERTENSRLKILISDTGNGMTAEEIQVALEPFSQIKRDSQIAKEGTGLGLPIVTGLVAEHGGEMTIKSTPNIGTTVTIIFPKNRLRSPTS